MSNFPRPLPSALNYSFLFLISLPPLHPSPPLPPPPPPPPLSLLTMCVCCLLFLLLLLLIFRSRSAQARKKEDGAKRGRRNHRKTRRKEDGRSTQLFVGVAFRAGLMQCFVKSGHVILYNGISYRGWRNNLSVARSVLLIVAVAVVPNRISRWIFFLAWGYFQDEAKHPLCLHEMGSKAL